jgi:outer membrane protein
MIQRFRYCLAKGLTVGLITGFAVTCLAGEVVRLTPEKVVELARKQSVAVKASQYSVAAQEHALKSARINFLPTISGSASAMHIFDKPQMELGGGGGFSFTSLPEGLDQGDMVLLQYLGSAFGNMKIETPDNICTFALNIAQPIFTGGKILNGYRAAKTGLEAQQYTYGRTVTETGLTAQKIYWGYVASMKGLETVVETRQWFETLLSDQQKMFDNGLIIELDLLNTKIQLDNFKLTEVKMRNSIRTMADQLLLYIGLQPGSPLEADTMMLSAMEPKNLTVAEDSVDRWLAGREDLLALQSQLKALKYMKNIQLGSFWPTIAAFGSYGANNQYSTREDVFKKSSSIGVQLSWTLVDWGKAWHDAQKTQCQLEAAQLQAHFMTDQIRAKYFELVRKVDEAKIACDIAMETRQTAEKALKVAKLKYDAQATTNTELLKERIQLTEKIVAYSLARINLILAVEEFKVAPVAMGQAASPPGGQN